MLWITYTILAIILFATVNIIDKVIVDKHVKEPLVPVMISSIIGLLFTISLFLLKGFGQISSLNIFLAVVSGGSYMLMGYYYFKAACVEEISRIIPLFYISNVLVAFFAAVFLGEVLSPLQYSAIAMILIGVILISVKNLKAPRLDKGTLYMIFAASFVAFSLLINKFVLKQTDFWTVFGLNRLGNFLFLIPLVFINRKRVLPALKKLNRFSLGLVSSSEVVNLTAMGFLTAATAIGLVTIVTNLAAVQPLIVFIFTIILSYLFPKILKEELNKKIFIQKFVALILILAGAYFLI